jgi:hypothetical protein
MDVDPIVSAGQATNAEVAYAPDVRFLIIRQLVVHTDPLP